MVNADEIISNSAGLLKATNHLFKNKKDSRVDFCKVSMSSQISQKLLKFQKF